jgi:hypothetical protein
MQFEGTTSWRFAVSAGDERPHLALFVRDAVGLRVADSPDVPPKLAGVVPEHRDLLNEDERQVAQRQWTSWWVAVIGLKVQEQEASDSDIRVSPELLARREQAGSPPDFAALIDRPELRRAVVETFLEAHRWVSSRRLGSRGEQDALLPHRLIGQVAEDVAFDRSVDIGDVRGSAVVLDVEGSWRHLLAPGIVMCSMAAAAAPDEARLVLRQAFESGLKR